MGHILSDIICYSLQNELKQWPSFRNFAVTGQFNHIIKNPTCDGSALWHGYESYTWILYFFKHTHFALL